MFSPLRGRENSCKRLWAGLGHALSVQRGVGVAGGLNQQVLRCLPSCPASSASAGGGLCAAAGAAATPGHSWRGARARAGARALQSERTCSSITPAMTGYHPSKPPMARCTRSRPWAALAQLVPVQGGVVLQAAAGACPVCSPRLLSGTVLVGELLALNNLDRLRLHRSAACGGVQLAFDCATRAEQPRDQQLRATQDRCSGLRCHVARPGPVLPALDTQGSPCPNWPPRLPHQLDATCSSPAPSAGAAAVPARLPTRAPPAPPPCSATKGAIVSFTRSLAQQLAPQVGG